MRLRHLPVLGRMKALTPLSVPVSAVLDKSIVDRACFADNFSWTMSPWHRLMPFWGCYCCSIHDAVQDCIVCSQWLYMAIVNHVLSKAPMIS